MMLKPKSQTKESYYPVLGGEHLDTPARQANPGWARFAYNYELDLEGRPKMIDGYERFDGHPKPSDASYLVLDFDSGNAEMTASDVVTGDTSGATGDLLYQILESGSYAGSDAAGYLVLTNVSGIFQDNEDLKVSGVTEAVSASTAIQYGSDTSALHTTYIRAAIEHARTQILAVTGSGSLLGVWQYNGVKYAFRNNAGGTACGMFKSSATGWTACDLGRSVDFTSGGVTEISENNTVTGATSGATGVVKRVILTSGTWAGGDAAGTFILYSQSGTFQAENLDVGVTPNLATIGGNSTENTLQPSGRFEFVNYNFGGHSGTYRMYGVDGVSKGFEWDGSVFVPITTGMANDTPEHLLAHKFHLFFSFSGGSLQHSSLNNPPVAVAPYIWSVVTGAAELGIGDEITGLFRLPGGILGVKARNSTYLLYGSSSADWELKTHDPEAGSIEWSGQLVENILVTMDDRGLTTLRTTQEYGDFKSATISKDIHPFLKSKLSSVVCSTRVKDKGQYRVYFDDGQGVYMTLADNKILGFTRVNLDDTPTCICSSENSDGEEEIYFGDSSGMVYQMDKGTSFDGDAIETGLRLHYNHLGSARQKFRLHKLFLEMDAPGNTEMSIYIEYDYGGGTAGSLVSVDVSPSGGIWEIDSWDTFVWDGQDVSTGEIPVKGSGTCFSPMFYTSSTYIEPHTIQGIGVLYSQRGLKR